MELWRTADSGAERPEVLCSRNLTVALALHVGVFLVFWIYAVCHGLFNKEEDVIPIDLTVVVNENLDGVEDDPPPLQNPEPPPPPPKSQPKPVEKKLEPPKELEKIVTNVVKKVEKKKEEKRPEKKKEPEKKEPEKKEPEEPKKSAKELREERLQRMRQSATTVNKSVTITVKNAPSGNGRTDKKTLTDAQIRDLLNKGYKPGKSEQLAASDEQLGYSLIKMAFESKWDQPPWTDRLKPMTIRVWFGGGGRIVSYKLETTSGDVRADQSIRSAASRVGTVPGLPAAFIEKYRSSGVPVRFTVKPR